MDKRAVFKVTQHWTVNLPASPPKTSTCFSSDNSALISSAVELYATHKLLSHEGDLNSATEALLANVYSSCPGKSPLSKVSYLYCLSFIKLSFNLKSRLDFNIRFKSIKLQTFKGSMILTDKR